MSERDQDDLEHFERLLERSSLGTPGARRLRRRTLPTHVAAARRIYQLRKAPFDQLRDWLEQTERFWSAQLDAFKAHVERTRGGKR